MSFWDDLDLSHALAMEREQFKRLGYADCSVCRSRVKGSGPWCELYQQGELPCVGKRMGPQQPEVPQP